MQNMISLESINYVVVLLEGILSFLSPCILPLIPIYISYLAGNGKEIDENGNIIYKRKTVFINTVLFVLGISFTFFLLGMSFSALGSFFKEYKDVITKISGIIIIIMGLLQIGVIKNKFFETEHKLNININKSKVTPLIAFIMGFTFSFAWTPCIGPALASVLTLASSTTNLVEGNLLILLYTIGFAVPFLLLGLFTTKILNFLKEKKKIVKYTIKISGILLIIVGILTLTGTVERIGSFLGNTDSLKEKQKNEVVENTTTNNETVNNSVSDEGSKTQEKQLSQAIDFTLQDQYGNTHKLSDYKGKVVFINFWATWCPPCKQELPHIEEIYKEYGENKNDVVILGVTAPMSNENRNARDEKNQDEIKSFLTENKLTFPVVFDTTGEIFDKYNINSYPTTIMINKDGEVYGYVMGALQKSSMKSIIEQTMENKKK